MASANRIAIAASRALAACDRAARRIRSAGRRWEHDLLPARVADYDPEWLDELFTRGEVVWGRLQPPRLTDDSRGQVLTRIAPISLVRRADLAWLLPPERDDFARLRPLGCTGGVRSARRLTAHCSSTTCSRRRSCCRRNWKMRCASWPRWAW